MSARINIVKKLILAILLLAATWFPVLARAGGFILPSGGAAAAGMAGSWVAQGDDLSVLDHNPAQLVRFSKYRGEVHYNAYLMRSSFDPAPVQGLGSGEISRNTADFVNHIPNLYGTVPVNAKLHVGFGLYTPVGPRHTYSNAGATRYQMQQATQTLAWPTVSVAYRATDWMAAALSIDVPYVEISQQFALGLVPGFRSLDGTLMVTGSGVQTPRPKLGLLFDLPRNLTLGVVALPGFDIKINGRIEADVPQVGLRPSTAHDDIVASQRVPTEARLGLGWRSAPWRAEVAARYYRWSEYKEQTVDLKRNRIGDFEIADLSVEKFYKDSIAVQVGAGFQFLERHEVRAGYLYDQQAAQDAGLTIQDFDSTKHLVAAGYGVKFADRYSINLGYNHVFYEPRAVAQSETLPIAVLGPPPELGNGTYEWDVDMFLISAGVDL